MNYIFIDVSISSIIFCFFVSRTWILLSAKLMKLLSFSTFSLKQKVMNTLVLMNLFKYNQF